MKYINKKLILGFAFLSLIFTSCETTNLDLLDDPNELTIEKATLDRFFNKIQLDYNNFIRVNATNAAQLTRINYMFGGTYENNYSPARLNFEWNLAYQNMFSDMNAAESIAVELNANKHIGIMKILKAHTLITLVDMFGDVPLSQASQPEEFPFPILDSGSSVYEAAIILLDEGISSLTTAGDDPENDLFYNFNYANWRKFANTIKLLAYYNTRLVDNSAINKFNTIISEDDYISSSSFDCQYEYGVNITSPDTRHPSYSTDYATSGAGNYKSIWLMDTMLNSNDPRIRYFFRRQTNCTPGASCDPDGDPTTSTCSIGSRPTHFNSDMPFCYVEDGYWGRDHGNDEGIPKDTFVRTAYGVYPAGGAFDSGVVGDEENHPFTSVVSGDGAQGAGINPILLASWVDFMRAEIALASNNPGGASNFLESALQKNIAKVTSFISRDTSADSSVEPSNSDISNFISSIVSNFNNANTEEKWNILATQVFVANYGNGLQAYNMYRRTGFPTNVQFNIEQNSGPFVRSFLYPASEANSNSNVEQKPDVAVQVFWDNNASSPQFPNAN